MTELKTNLVAVTIYPDRARLERKGRQHFESGLHQIEIHELPLALNPDSMRAAGRGLAKARLMGLQVKRSFYRSTPVEAVQALEERLEAAQDELTGLEAQMKLIAQQRASLVSLAGQSRIFARALVSGERNIEDQFALLDSIEERLASLDRQELALQVAIRSQQRKLEQLKNELEAQRSSRPRERYTAIVEVEVVQAGELEITLSYVVSQAGWQPLYDLRLLEEGDQSFIEVGYLAQITQNTGEPWTEVALTLSTARPALAENLPELQPWYIRPRPTRPPAPLHAKIASQAADVMPMMAAAPPAEEIDWKAASAPVEELTAQVGESGAAVTYTVPGLVSIPADGAPHKVTVSRFKLQPQLDYVAAPKLVEAVYRRARLTNDSPYTLLPGLANLFDDEEFIGSTRLELIAPDAPMELYLGVDDRIKVVRELKRREMDKTIIGGKRRINYRYEIQVENLLPFDARLTIHDQAPVGLHEEIKVRLEAIEPRPSKQSDLNLLEWELVLAPKAKRTIQLNFVVEYPQSMEVIGLP